MSMIKWIVSVMCAVIVSSISVSAETAPDFKLLSTAGATVTLSQFKGKVVFVDFWATWCPPCRKSIPAVEKMYEQYSHNPHVVIVGINVEKDPAATLSFVMKNTLKYTILNDDGSASKAYRISGIPAFFIVGPDGAITKHFVGYQSDMEKDWMTEINDQLKKM